MIYITYLTWSGMNKNVPNMRFKCEKLAGEFERRPRGGGDQGDGDQGDGDRGDTLSVLDRVIGKILLPEFLVACAQGEQNSNELSTRTHTLYLTV